MLQTGTTSDEDDESFIVRNTSNKTIKKPEYISELHRYTSKCIQCKTIIQKVRCLLEEIKIIKENEIIGICNECKRSRKNKCDKCEFAVNKFAEIYERGRKEKQKRFKDWLGKVNHLLESLLNGEEICQHGVYKDAELERLLQDLKEPLDVRQSDIDFFPTLEDELSSKRGLTESKILLEKLLSKMKSEAEEHAAKLYPSQGFCICKYLSKKQIEEVIPDYPSKQTIKGSQATILSKEPPEDFVKSLSQEDCKDIIKRLMVLSQDLPRGMHLNKQLILDLIETIDIATKRGLSINIVKKLIDQLRQLHESIGHESFKGLNKLVITELVDDLNALLTKGSSRTINKRLLDFLSLLYKLLAAELGKTLQKEKIPSKFGDLDHTPHRDLSLDAKEGSSLSPLRNESSYMKYDRPESEIDETIYLLPSSGGDKLRHDVGPQKLKSHDEKHDVAVRVPTPKVKGTTESKKSMLPPVKVKSILSSKLPIDKKSTLKIKIQEKSSSLISLSLLKTIPEKRAALLRSLNKERLKEDEKASLKYEKSLVGNEVTLSKKTQTDDAGKDAKHGSARQLELAKQKKGKEEEITMSKACKKKLGSIIHALGNLIKALDKGDLSDKLLQHLTSDVHDILGEKPMDILNNIIKELVELCKPVAEGAPKNMNLKLVQEMINDATKVLSQTLSENENKEVISDLLYNLNKVLMPVKKESDRKKGARDSDDIGEFKRAIAGRLRVLSSKRLQASLMGVSGTKTKQGLRKKSKVDKEKQEIQEQGGKTILSIEGFKALEKARKKKPLESTSNISMTSRKPKQPPEVILQKILQPEKESERIKELKLLEQEAKQLEMSKMNEDDQSLSKFSTKSRTVIVGTPSSIASATSVVYCDERIPKIPKVMIKGERIVPYDAGHAEHLHEIKHTILKTHQLTDEGRGVKKKAEIPEFDEQFGSGILRYRLSKREFIEKGWTLLPTKKVMRRMNIYKMKPSQPHRDWFKLHRNSQLYYDSGETLARVGSDGRGRWYYRSGLVALEYYNARDSYVGQRYVVYSSGEEVDHGRIKPRTILALFDVQGNGVVYDHYGNVRLKYNQSEGVLLDPTLGPPCKWKWHTLNDPPVLQQVILNPQLKVRDSRIEDIGETERGLDSNPIERKIHHEMLEIELDNFAKEKTSKLLQKFKRLEIRMKAIKLNAQFSLKILDQETINLYFRDGTTSLKLNLGFILISDEIIDTDTAEMTDVATPYDSFPAKSPSVEDIQYFLKSVNARYQKSCPTRV